MAFGGIGANAAADLAPPAAGRGRGGHGAGGDPILIAGAAFESDRPRYDIAGLLALSDDDSPVENRAAPVWKAPTSGGSTGRPKLILAGGPGVFTPAEGPGPYRTGPDDVFIMPGPSITTVPSPHRSAAQPGRPPGDPAQVRRRGDPEGGRAPSRNLDVSGATMMSRIWRLPTKVRESYDVSSLKTVWHLAAPCPPWLKKPGSSGWGRT